MSKRTIIIVVIAIVLIAAGLFSLYSEKQKEINDLLNVNDSPANDEPEESNSGGSSNTGSPLNIDNVDNPTEQNRDETR